MWKYVFHVCLITLEVWKCGNMSSLSSSRTSPSVEMWKCGNMSSLSSSSNSGSVEMWKCGNMSSLSLSNNSGSVEMWKCGNMSSLSLFLTLAVWKCGSVKICLHCLYLVTLEVQQCGMWKYVFIVLIYLVPLEVWKCGNVEICLHCLYLITLEGWKCGNVPPLSLSINTESVDMKRNVSSSLTLILLVQVRRNTPCKAITSIRSDSSNRENLSPQPKTLRYREELCAQWDHFLMAI